MQYTAHMFTYDLCCTLKSKHGILCNLTIQSPTKKISLISVVTIVLVQSYNCMSYSHNRNDASHKNNCRAK